MTLQRVFCLAQRAEAKSAKVLIFFCSAALLLVSPWAVAEDCVCKNIDARSVPARSNDICERGEAEKRCTMYWNIPRQKQVSPDLGRFYDKFAATLLGLDKLTKLPLDLQAVTAPDRQAQLVERLRLPNYSGQEVQAAAIFLALAAGTLGSLDATSEVDELLNLAPQLDKIGAAISGSDSSFSPPLKSLVVDAREGCLQLSVRSTTRRVIVENLTARVKRTCP